MKLDIYLVSLEKDKNRRLDLNIIPDITFAVDGSKLDISKLKKDKILSEDCNLKRGEIGCYLSHVYLLNKILESKTYTLILEDDVLISNKILYDIENIILKAPTDFELLSIGYNYYEQYTYKNIKYLHGTQAYIVNPNNISHEIINSLLPIRNKPYDVILPTIFKMYIVEPKIVELNSKHAYISNTAGIL